MQMFSVGEIKTESSWEFYALSQLMFEFSGSQTLTQDLHFHDHTQLP
jgi:hypothetical protein